MFACPIGSKLVSICGRAGGAVYRFGRPARVELEAGGLRFAERAFSGGGETQVSFEREGSRYIVYDRLVRTAFGGDGRHDAQASAGVLVRKAGKTILDAQCVGSSGGGMDSALAKYIPPGHFIER